MDEDAVCQSIYRSAEGAEREKLYCKFVDMSKAVNVRHPSGNNRAKPVVESERSQGEGDAYYDQTSEQHIVSRHAVRQALWNKHLKNPTLFWMKLCEAWRSGTVLSLRRQSGAGVE